MAAISGITKSKVRGIPYATWRIRTGIIASVNNGEYFTITNGSAAASRLKIAAPQDDGDATTKAYVDNKGESVSGLFSELVNPERFGIFARANFPYLHDGVSEAPVYIPQAALDHLPDTDLTSRFIAISPNGLVVILWNTVFYDYPVHTDYLISRDGGNTFKQFFDPIGFYPGPTKCRMSYDGRHIFITGPIAGAHLLLVSHDYGETFTFHYGVGTQDALLDCSLDGKYVYRWARSPGTWCRSEDYGETFVDVFTPDPDIFNGQASVSADGRAVLLYATTIGSAGISISTDYGATFYPFSGGGSYIHSGKITEDGSTFIILIYDLTLGTGLKTNWQLIMANLETGRTTVKSFFSIAPTDVIEAAVMSSWNGNRVVVAFGLDTSIVLFNIVNFSDVFETTTPTLSSLPAPTDAYSPQNAAFLTGDGAMLFLTVPVASSGALTTYLQSDPSTPIALSKVLEETPTPSGQTYDILLGQTVYSRDGYNSISRGFRLSTDPWTMYFTRRKYTPILETRRPQLTLDDKGTLALNQYEDGLVVLLMPNADFNVDLPPALSFIGKHVTFVKFVSSYTVTLLPAPNDGIESGDFFKLSALAEKVTLTAISPTPGVGLWMTERDVPIRHFCASARFVNADLENPADFVLGLGQAAFAGLVTAFQAHYRDSQTGNWGVAAVKLQIYQAGMWFDAGPSFNTTATSGNATPVVSNSGGLGIRVHKGDLFRAYITLPAGGSFSAMIDVTLGQFVGGGPT